MKELTVTIFIMALNCVIFLYASSMISTSSEEIMICLSKAELQWDSCKRVSIIFYKSPTSVAIFAI